MGIFGSKPPRAAPPAPAAAAAAPAAAARPQMSALEKYQWENKKTRDRYAMRRLALLKHEARLKERTRAAYAAGDLPTARSFAQLVLKAAKDSASLAQQAERCDEMLRRVMEGESNLQMLQMIKDTNEVLRAQLEAMPLDRIEAILTDNRELSGQAKDVQELLAAHQGEALESSALTEEEASALLAEVMAGQGDAREAALGSGDALVQGVAAVEAPREGAAQTPEEVLASIPAVPTHAVGVAQELPQVPSHEVHRAEEEAEGREAIAE